MRKMRLDVDALRVESFAAEDARVEAGTVRGHDATEDYTCPRTCDDGSCRTLVCACVVTHDQSNCVCPTG